MGKVFEVGMTVCEDYLEITTRSTSKNRSFRLQGCASAITEIAFLFCNSMKPSDTEQPRTENTHFSTELTAANRCYFVGHCCSKCVSRIPDVYNYDALLTVLATIC